MVAISRDEDVRFGVSINEVVVQLRLSQVLGLEAVVKARLDIAVGVHKLELVWYTR